MEGLCSENLLSTKELLEADRGEEGIDLRAARFSAQRVSSGSSAPQPLTCGQTKPSPLRPALRAPLNGRHRAAVSERSLRTRRAARWLVFCNRLFGVAV